jgi:hypothetical protein
VLVAGLMPEEVQDEAAAERLRRVQLQLLARLATQHPAALFYSNFFRWVQCGRRACANLPEQRCVLCRPPTGRAPHVPTFCARVWSPHVRVC